MATESQELRHDEDHSSGNHCGSTWRKLRSNTRIYRGGIWAEVNGAMGDLGTYIPIAVALTLENGLDVSTTLLLNGAYNVLTGLLFGVPMPVQPMKAIASVAIGQDHLSIPQIMAAGLCTAAALLGLGISGLMGLIYSIIPLPVIRAVQLSQGLSFAVTAVKYMRNDQDLAKNKSLGSRPWLGLDGLLLALICFFFILFVNGSDSVSCCSSQDSVLPTTSKPTNPDDETPASSDSHSNPNPTSKSHFLRAILFSLPSALLVFITGLVLAIVRKPGAVKHFKLGPSKPRIVVISRTDWRTGFLKAAVPQIPLSVLNSVIALCKLSLDLFPHKIDVTASRVSVSVGLMNLVGCWFGAMPVCHGAGGLAGQYKFGAKSGASVVFLGTLKILVGIILGKHLVDILRQFPVGILGVLLLYAGIELAVACRDMTSKRDSFVMLMSTGVALTGSSASLGFVAGMLIFIAIKVREQGIFGAFANFKSLLCSASSPAQLWRW